MDAHGFDVTKIAADDDFKNCASGLHNRFESAHRFLAEVGVSGGVIQSLFAKRFEPFAEPTAPADVAVKLVDHHVKVQRGKSADGKRPWFDRLGENRIYVRQAYREKRRAVLPGRYVHDYRGLPIRRFRQDLRSDLA